jgi:hypothetical protein
MQHDIDYLRPGYFNAVSADAKAIANSNWDWDGIAMKLGLTGRTLLSTLVKINPALWLFEDSLTFNKPAYADPVENQLLIDDLQSHFDDWYYV